jgi:hypothetical protein
MSDSSIEMKKTSPCAATFKANGGFNGSPLRNDYPVVGGREAAKGSFRQSEICGRKFCHRDRHPSVGFTVPVRMSETSFRCGNALAFRDQRHHHHLVVVRVYYREKRFIEGFTEILAMQFCVSVAHGSRKFLSYLSIDMKTKESTSGRNKAGALCKN